MKECKLKESLKKISILRNGYRIARFYKDYIYSRRVLSKQITGLSQDDSSMINDSCPICKSDSIATVSLVVKGDKISKCFCIDCLHLYSKWLASDLDKVQELFDYDQETSRVHEQKYLLREAMKCSNDAGCFLDFGVGGNIAATVEMQEELPEHTFYGCDLNKRDDRNYFVTYTDDEMIGKFDAIASNSVIEHLDDTMQTWGYFNKLLKPGGWMVHSFPSQMHFDWSHWGLAIERHVCLFSSTSLRILCAETGFKFIKWRYSTRLRWPMFYFQKS